MASILLMAMNKRSRNKQKDDGQWQHQMSDDKCFAGIHRFLDGAGSFMVFRIDQYWYWQRRQIGEIEPEPFGPYATAEGAYLAATEP
jgi:hypothetical protein